MKHTQEPLIIGDLSIYPIDKDGDFELTINHFNETAYKYISTEEAKIIIKYLQESIKK